MPYITNPYTDCPDYYEEATPGPIGPPGPQGEPGEPGEPGGVVSINGQDGVVVLGTDDVSDAGETNKYVTAADLVVLGNTSGTNTGDQTITLTGDVTGSGTGSFATVIDDTAIGGKVLESPLSGAEELLINDAGTLKKTTASDIAALALVGSAVWGGITGTLSDQLDLQAALDGKVDENVAIVSATKTKITYDAKGLVTVGADATTADIADSLNKRYVTDAELVVIGNTSGTNTGDQTSIVGITGTLAEFNTALTGADFATGGGTVTGTSSGTNTGDQTSIVGITGTLAEFNTALTGADFATGGGTVTGASSGTNTGDQTITLTGDVTGSGTGSFAATIGNLTVTSAKIATGVDAVKIADGSVTNTEFQFINTVTSNVQTQIDGKQTLDSTLTALAAYNTNGILTQTAADTFTGRTITGTTNQVTVSNGDGVSGNPTLSLPQNIHTAATPTFASVTMTNLAQFTNASEPSTPSGAGVIYSATGAPAWKDPAGRLHGVKTEIVVGMPDITGSGVTFSGAKTKSGWFVLWGDQITFWYRYEDWINDVAFSEIRFSLPITPATGQTDFALNSVIYVADYTATVCWTYGGSPRIRTYDYATIPISTSLYVWITGTYTWR